MRPGQDPPEHAQLIAVATDALRWVANAAVATRDGATWPETRAPDAPRADDLYAGTAGVLVGFAEARLSGITDFDDHARAAVAQLRARAAAGLDRIDDTDPGLYTGLAGMLVGLDIWGQASGDLAAREAARDLALRLARIVAAGPVSPWRDIIAGDAGILLVLTGLGGPGAEPGAWATADRLVAATKWIDGMPDWYARADYPVFLPNFSHGAAGIGCALAAAAGFLDRPELLEIAELAARRLIRLGQRADGTLAVPHSIPLADLQAPVSYGWCHGPTGTLRLFEILDRERPGQGWADWADACRLAVRRSGLPERKYPGFWDNIGQCCGTAGVAEIALDYYQASSEPDWLTWAAEDLTKDILARHTIDESGVRWSHTEHRRPQPLLEPEVGWMQGAAGIAGWLLRLARVEQDGTKAVRLRWPDQPGLELGA
jgi:lantibiotic modifying enzyme